MNILTINVGSSTIKYSFFNNHNIIFSGRVDRIGFKNPFILEKKRIEKINIKNFKEGAKVIAQKKLKLNPDIIVYRVVYAKNLNKPTNISNSTLKKIKEGSNIAPLHNPNTYEVIKFFKSKFKSIPHLAVFDTSIHSSIPEKNKTYAIPKKFKFEKNGFHGLVYEYVIDQLDPKKMISIHLGNGCSAAAIKNKKVIDTSMGYTPLDGLIMGTRCGSIDPGIILELAKKLGIKKTEEILWKDSGIKSLANHSDMRIVKKKKRNNLALEKFFESIIEIIGSYYFKLNGVNSICFTGGISENEFWFIKKLCKKLSFLDIRLTNKKEGLVSHKNSKIEIFILKAREDEVLKKHGIKFLRRKNAKKRNSKKSKK